MARIAIATDSTAYLPDELVSTYHIHTIPLNVLFGEEAYLDNVDMDASTFYKRLGGMKGSLPTTSQPSAGAFCDFYRQIAADADEIISVHISADLSGTVDSALQAKAMLPDTPIHVIDSRMTSMAQGYAVLEAARAVADGATAAEAVQRAQDAIGKMRLYFAVDTLRYLHMGGRIGGASVLLGTALGIKPILEITGGKVDAVCKVRSMKRAIPKLVDMLAEQFGEGTRVRAAAIHATNPDGARDLAELVQGRFDCVEMHVGELSPVLGTHAGPGTVGVVAYPV